MFCAARNKTRPCVFLIAEHWLVVQQAVHCRVSQMSGTVEVTGRESKNEIRFCESSPSRTPESDDRACAQAAIARKRSGVFRRSGCRTYRPCCQSELRALLRERVSSRFHD